MKSRTLIKIFTLLLALVMGITAITACSNPSEAKYAEAVKLLEEGNYEAAYKLFTELGDYKDAKAEAAKFHYAVVSETYESIDEKDAKTTDTMTITYNENNLPARAVRIYADGLEHVCVYSYNANGKLTKVECSENGVVTDTFERYYDENGNISKEIFDYAEDVKSTEEFTYNENGDCLTITVSYEDGTSTLYNYEYTEDGKRSKVVCRYDDNTTSTYVYTYNEAGDIATGTMKDADGNVTSTDAYTYNEKGLLIKTTYESDDMSFETVYTYDENDRVATDITTYSDGDVYGNEYAYDTNGNVIKKIETEGEKTTFVCNTTFKLVYVPFEYSETEWDDLAGESFYWWW